MNPLDDRVIAALGDQYEILSEIGRGGMAVVYRARDRRLGREVAVKVLPPELAYDPAIRARFTREAQTAAQLSHAHIVPIYDVGERDGVAYFVMAHVGGGNLATLLAREPRQTADEVRRIVGQIADALAYAHLRGVIHRDVKPDNILLDAESGRAMVSDFGIARAMEAGARLTLTGVAVGTPTYMSPEQATGEREVDGRSDVYSLGVIAYQMLTGRVPFTAGNPMALLLKHISERPRAIAELRPDVPRALREAIERSMAKVPDDRWPTAAALRDALAAGDASAAPWRADAREPVRYASPRPDGPRAELRPLSPRRGTPSAMPVPAATPPSPVSNGVVLEAPHLATLTAEQRADLRLWGGRVNLIDRIKAMRRLTALTLATYVAGFATMAVGMDQGSPLVLAPIIPLWMSLTVWRRGQALQAAGLKLRRVLLMPRSKWVIPRPSSAPTDRQLDKLAPREVLDGMHGAAIRRAVEERIAIAEIVNGLPKTDRALLPELQPSVDALVDRVAHLAQLLHRLDHSFDPRAVDELEARLSAAQEGSESPEGARRIALLRRQRATLDELAQRRAALVRQLDSAGLALGNLRLDLIKLRSSDLRSALSDLTSATQQARALSTEIGAVIDAVEEMRDR